MKPTETSLDGLPRHPRPHHRHPSLIPAHRTSGYPFQSCWPCRRCDRPRVCFGLTILTQPGSLQQKQSRLPKPRANISLGKCSSRVHMPRAIFLPVCVLGLDLLRPTHLRAAKSYTSCHPSPFPRPSLTVTTTCDGSPTRKHNAQDH